MFQKVKNYITTIFDNDGVCVKTETLHQKTTEKVPNNISEPVTSFLRVFKDNPRRFRIKTKLSRQEIREVESIRLRKSIKYTQPPERLDCTFTDTKTGEVFEFFIQCSYGTMITWLHGYEHLILNVTPLSAQIFYRQGVRGFPDTGIHIQFLTPEEKDIICKTVFEHQKFRFKRKLERCSRAELAKSAKAKIERGLREKAERLRLTEVYANS